MKAEEANARLMLMAAATVTLPRVEAALIYYPLPKKVQKQQQQSYQMPPGGPFMGGGMGMGMGMGGVGRGMGGEMMMMSPDAASLSPEMLSMMGAMFQQQQVAPTSLQNFGAQGVSSSLSAMQQPPIPFQPLAPAPLVPPPPPPLMSEAELNQLLQSLAHPPPPPPPLSMDFS